MPLPFEYIPIHLLPVGSVARVAELMGEVEQVRRLEELGIRRGVQVKMVSSGNPCIVQIDGSRLCFRRSELLSVLVVREEAA